MGTWFDGMAKRAARGEVEDAGSGSGPTRRQVLVGTAAVTGAMWTAPMLMSAASALNAASCPAGTTLDTCPDQITAMCCPTDQSCGFDPISGLQACVPDNSIGGRCSNNGEGQCGSKFGFTGDARCNGKTDPNICGGEDAGCGSRDEICATGFTCVIAGPGDPNPPAGSPGTCQRV